MLINYGKNRAKARRKSAGIPMNLSFFGKGKGGKRRKSLKMGQEELGELIKECVKEALDESDKDEDKDKSNDYDGGYEGEYGVLRDVIDDIVKDAVEDAIEKAKSDDEEGEEKSYDDLYAYILEYVEDYIEEHYDDYMEGYVKEEGKASDGREVPSGVEEIGDGKKTSQKPSQKKSGGRAHSARQRKYSELYIPSRGRSTEEETKKIPPEIRLARAVKCIDVFQGGSIMKDPERAAHYARKHYGDSQMEREFKALSATTPSEGGYLIPEVYVQEIIELLYAKTVIFELGARKLPMENGNLNVPKMKGGSRARWGGEKRKIASTQPTFGNIRLSAKRLEAIVASTRELLMSTNFSADAIFAQDLIRQMELGLDFGALYGSGGEFEPTGVSNTKGILTLDALSLSNPELADAAGRITASFPVYVRSQVLIENVDDHFLGWTFNSLLEGYMMNLKTATGAFIYREEMQNGRLLGAPYRVSNQIPYNKATETTEMFFGNWSDLMVGEQLGLETYTTLDGSWTDNDGVQHNAFEENLAGTRALMYVDIAARHEQSFACIKNIKVA